MSTVGTSKALLTKAVNALRQKKTDVEPSILERLVLTGIPGEDEALIYNRKTILTNTSASIKHSLNVLKERWDRAQKLAESSPAVEGDPPLLDEFQSHWDSLAAEELVEEMEVLLIRLDTALSLLPPDKTSPCPTSCPPLPVSINTRSAQDSALPPDQTKVQRTPYSTTKKVSEYDQRTWPGVSSYIGYTTEQPPINTGSADDPYARAYFGTQTQHSISDSMPLTHMNGTASELSGRHNGRDIMNDVVATASTSPFVQQVKLPTLELPEFDGSVDAFPEFWDLFSAAVHNNASLPPAHKFLYLKSYLKGTASSIIANFQPTAQNYDEAVRTILSTYHRPDILRNKLWDKLTAQPKAGNSAISQRVTLCGIKAIWAQMKKLSEHSGSTGTMKGHVALKETVAIYAFAAVIEPRNAENYVIQENVEKCVLHLIFAGDVLDLDTVAHNAPSRNVTNVMATITCFCATETSVSHEVQKGREISAKVVAH
ncbi:hypothetical protein ANCCAN_06827 [Ancylostoma caninum]|uniref:Uncharacterized protein n=1 Tax=Ancylostoma caninum TaxID=29170 RepID=A0A368GS05_ANCCA|nr:hypothetical protein ANCCAN_06827 [Ancylostoma caninum]